MPGQEPTLTATNLPHNSGDPSLPSFSRAGADATYLGRVTVELWGSGDPDRPQPAVKMEPSGVIGTDQLLSKVITSLSQSFGT